jgi:hypothetical protein|tara:strand:+ start:335 stop:517 length:183 start_codon:yes stop_codon:yes gene_type:complete
MNESTLDLFCERADREAHAFAMELESKAAALEVTVDYYLEEFHDVVLEHTWIEDEEDEID